MHDTNLIDLPCSLNGAEPEPGPPTLTDDERARMAELDEREYALSRVLTPRLQADAAEFRRDVERRLGLRPGALGRTHAIDAERGVVVPIAP